MHKYTKKIISIILVLSIILVNVSCNNKRNINIDLKENQIIDAIGNVIDIKDNANELTVASVYAVSVPFFSALKMTDRVKAINVKSKFWKDVDKNL